MQHNVETLGNGTYMAHARDNYSDTLGKESTNWMLLKIKK